LPVLKECYNGLFGGNKQKAGLLAPSFVTRRRPNGRGEIQVMLRAFVDESGTGGRDGVFVMGAVVAFVVKWEEFVTPWCEILQNGTPVPYFRTSSFRSEEWRTERRISKKHADEKTEALSRGFTYPPLLFSVCVSVKKQDYREAITEKKLYKGAGKLGSLWLKTPYAYCFHNIVALTLEKIVDQLGIGGDIVDFVFDRNDPLFDAANAMFRELRHSFDDTRWRATLGDVIPANDEVLIPLQAADLLAGRLKDYCEAPTSDSARAVLAVSGTGDRNITRHITRARLDNFAKSLPKKGGALLYDPARMGTDMSDLNA
jgi:Protein of unknown function (DUF3800)